MLNINQNNTIDSIDETQKYQAFMDQYCMKIDWKYAIYNRYNRTFILIKIGNFCVPFYRSSEGTDWKTPWRWFAYFGFTQDGRSISKWGSVYEMENGYQSKKIKEMHDLINQTLTYPHKYDLEWSIETALPFVRDHQTNFIDQDFGPKVPQGVNANDDKWQIWYQNAWINMIEWTTDRVYVYTINQLMDICKETTDQNILDLAINYNILLVSSIARLNKNLTDSNIKALLSNNSNLTTLSDLISRASPLSLNIQKFLFNIILDTFNKNADPDIIIDSLLNLVDRSDFALANEIGEKWLKIIHDYMSGTQEQFSFTEFQKALAWL